MWRLRRCNLVVHDSFSN
uniref:Uncharacterized protein n=1 Tax=Lepeophtheirus salmonis TaxID=72036 RepID=A0A0K2VIG1_LEPSM